MGRQYSAKTFLRNTPDYLLKQFFEQRGIDLGFNWSYRHESDVNPVFAAMAAAEKRLSTASAVKVAVSARGDAARSERPRRRGRA